MVNGGLLSKKNKDIQITDGEGIMITHYLKMSANPRLCDFDIDIDSQWVDNGRTDLQSKLLSSSPFKPTHTSP